MGLLNSHLQGQHCWQIHSENNEKARKLKRKKMLRTGLFVTGLFCMNNIVLLWMNVIGEDSEDIKTVFK